MSRPPQTQPIHVFFVHSHITMLSAIAIIEEFDLRADDVRIVFLRGYELETPYISHRFSYISDGTWSAEFFGRSDLLGARRRLRKLDQIVADITGQRPTHYYFPHTGRDVYHLLITHPNTLSFNLLDEGTSAYNPRKSTYCVGRFGTGADSAKGILITFARRLFYSGVYGRRAMGAGEFNITVTLIGRGARWYFGFGEAAHPGAPRRYKLDLRKACDAASGIFDVPDLPHNTRLFALPSLLHRNQDDRERTLAGIRPQVIRAAKDGVSLLAYKSHPSMQGDRDATTQAVLDAAARYPNLRTEALAPNVCLEALIARNPHISLIAEGTSVGLYAKILGAEVV